MGSREPHTQRDMPKPHWPEDPPLSEPQTGRAAAFLYPFLVSPNSPPFLSPRIPSCPLIYPPFFVAKGSVVLDLSERSHHPPLQQIFTGTPAGLWSPACLSVPWLSPEGGPWALGTLQPLMQGKRLHVEPALLFFCHLPSNFGE